MKGVRLVRFVGRTDLREVYIKLQSKYLKGRDHLEDVRINARIILKWGLKKWDTRMWTRLILPRVGATGLGSYSQDNGTTRCIKDGEFLNRLSEHHFLKEVSVPLSQSDWITASHQRNKSWLVINEYRILSHFLV